VHVHLVASGYLFAWVVAGPDPGPARPTVRARLVVLGIAIAVHASLAQLLYAGLLVDVHEPVAGMRAAGDLMYYGGDLAELLLALALLLSWGPGHARSVRGAGSQRDRPDRVLDRLHLQERPHPVGAGGEREVRFAPR